MTITKAYMNAYSKWLFNFKIGREDKTIFYDGQVTILRELLLKSLPESSIKDLEEKAREKAIEDFLFYE